ncbi:hypothetical protein COOONC_12629 [Cooperia oncophora]
MGLFYLNLPWIINESEYNCSGRSQAEWESRGSVNEVQGIYFTVSGAIFVTLYVICLIGMLRGRLLKTPCYCLMFFNGIIDIMDIIAGSLIAAYFHLVSDYVPSACATLPIFRSSQAHCPKHVKAPVH